MLLVRKPTVEGRLATAAMFVRARIDERLTLETVAAAADFSPYHFHRIFRVAFGENLSAFVVRHRMQRAAHELRNTEQSIIDIGLRCGYETPSSFGRAFLRAFGMTPSDYRSAEGEPARIPESFIPTAIDISAPHDTEYSARAALALRHVGPYGSIGPAMQRLLAIAVARGFLPAADIVGLSYDSPDFEDHDALRFDACVTVVPGADLAGARADGLRDITIPGGRYAVFRHRGSYERITHAYDTIVAAWVLTGRVELRDAPFINTYLSNPQVVDAAELECDLAVPIL